MEGLVRREPAGHAWQPDIEYARLEGVLRDRPGVQVPSQGRAELSIELTEVKPLTSYAT